MTAPDRSTERILTACHEAGHAVISHYHKWPVAELTIVPAGGNLGHMRSVAGSLPDIWCPDTARIDAQIALAGPLAEACHKHGAAQIQITGSDWHKRSGADFQRAWHRCETAVANELERDAWMNDVATETHALLGRLWGMVEALAEELVWRGTIDAKELRRELALLDE